MKYQDENARAVDRWVAGGWKWGQPVEHSELEKARKGEWDVVLTPVKPVPHWWFTDRADTAGVFTGLKILGLASGGAQQMPVFSVLGASCTVFDYSPKQIESEIRTAQRENYVINAVRGDMTQPLPFPDENFDIIFNPVSNCYVEKVEPIWKECYRVLKRGGRLLAGFDNGFNYLFDEDETAIRHRLPFNPLKNPSQMESLRRDDSGVQFSHSIEEELGGQLRAGFKLLDIFEDTNGEGILHEHNCPCFYATCVEK
ncbi:MAG: class I SAM-dependent methyltransferase [Treponema sp.]|jgi:SAM-dependent methyltransferase|nr:class I SAM-dependent methyltransferase [Treponema sp.]